MPKRLLQTRNTFTVNKDRVSRKNVRNKEHIIISGVSHMIGDAVMNKIHYPMSETKILADLLGNKRVVMPSSHPTGDEGEFISASDPLALMSNFVGAFAFNFSIQDDRLISDVAIDPAVANTSDSGKQIIDAIENGDPIDVSTGFYLNVEDAKGIGSDGEPFTGVASNLFLDHVAFLPNEAGAKNKIDGVGLHTNSAIDVDGNKMDTDVALLSSNASTPAMQLPLAPNDHVWNEAKALARIKTFTNSDKKPSTNFRKFFLNFDQSNVDSFDSYTNLFADIIDGVPHAVKAPIESVSNNDNAKTYINRFAANKDSFITKAINMLKSIFKGNELSHSDIHEAIFIKLNEGRQENKHNLWPMDIFKSNFVYRGENDTMFQQSYEIDGDDIVFIGERTEVERVVEYKKVINKSLNMFINGALADLLNRTLDRKSKDEDEKSDLIDSMAAAAGIERGTVLQILRGDIDIPPDDRLEGFADVLGVSLESLKSLVPTTNSNGDRIMREKLIKALNAKGVKIEGLDDDAIFAAYNKLHDEELTEEEEEKLKMKKDKEKSKSKSKSNDVTLQDAVTKAVNAAIKPLQDQLNANADDELNGLSKQVGELDKGITEKVAKTMGVNALKDFLAKNGVPAFNTSGSQHQKNNDKDNCSSLSLPTSKVEA